MTILDKLYCDDVWREYLEYKISGAHFTDKERRELERFIEKRGYLPVLLLSIAAILPFKKRKIK